MHRGGLILPEPFNCRAGYSAGQDEQDACREAHSVHQRKGVDNPFAVFSQEQATETYFQAVPRLNLLREQVRGRAGFSVCDLIRKLDQLACQASFDPVGALNDGKTADVFFQGHEAFKALEAELARKICPANVSETLALVKYAGHYTPTRLIVQVIESVYQGMLSGEERAF